MCRYKVFLYCCYINKLFYCYIWWPARGWRDVELMRDNPLGCGLMGSWPDWRCYKGGKTYSSQDESRPEHLCFKDVLVNTLFIFSGRTTYIFCVNLWYETGNITL